jgi:hypothetical protein
MMRPKTASLAILGTAAIVISALAGPAMAEGKMGKAKYAQTQTKQSQTLTKGQRHATYHSQRIRRANAALPNERMYRRPAGPGEVAGNVVGGAVATAGAIATAPFRAFDNSYGNSYAYYDNYYGYGHGGRDWKTYAARNGLACTPGTMIKGADGRLHPCQ